MSDLDSQRLEEILEGEAWRYSRHPVVEAARRVLEPDYAATARLIASSLGDKLHDGHDTDGPCAGCHSDAERFVNAALHKSVLWKGNE